jgi:hypothetical protein
MARPGQSARGSVGSGRGYDGPFGLIYLNCRTDLGACYGRNVKLVVRSAVESLPANTSIVVASITQSLTAAFQ